MIGTLYRYPHPYDSVRFIYVGQGPNRDIRHRSGETSFGRRFKKIFPDTELPQPTKEQIEISGQTELNEEETVWMFRFHTWRGYPDGMNLTLPGLQDYKESSRLAQLSWNEEDKFRARSKGGLTSGHKALLIGQLDRIRNLPQT